MGHQNVEHTTKFVTSVDTLEEAWTFVMEYLPLLGKEPSIHISPVWILDWADSATGDSGENKHVFEVVVEGMTEIKREVSTLSVVPDE